MTIAEVRIKLNEAIVLLDALESPPTIGVPIFTLGPVLLEKASSNLAFPSNLNGWATTNASFSATMLTENSSNGFHEIYKSVTIGAGPHCHSAYVKAGTASKGRIWFVSASVGFFADFDLVAGTISAESNFGGSTPHKSFIVSAGDGWFRVGVSGTVSITSGSVDIALRNDAGATQYIGTGKYMFIRDVQSEAGLFPTSHITTASGIVARAQTAVIGTMTPLSQVTISVAAKTAIAWPADYAVLMHIDNNIVSNPYNDLEIFQNATGNIVARVTYNNTNYIEVNLGIIQPNTEFKLAITASSAGLRTSLNGSAVQFIAIPIWPTDLTQRRWGTQMQSIREWNSVLIEAKQWNVSASDLQLQQLSAP